MDEPDWGVMDNASEDTRSKEHARARADEAIREMRQVIEEQRALSVQLLALNQRFEAEIARALRFKAD